MYGAIILVGIINKSTTLAPQMSYVAMQCLRARFLQLPAGWTMSAAFACTDSMIWQRKFSDKKKGAKEDGPKSKQLKVKKKERPKKVDESSQSREYNLIISALDAPMRKEPPISEEEKARRHEIGRNYTIGRFRFHNEVHHDLTCKMHLKTHAINMLPRDSKIKEEALIDNTEDPPPWRRLPSWTPPIPNFDPSEYMIKSDDK